MRRKVVSHNMPPIGTLLMHRTRTRIKGVENKTLMVHQTTSTKSKYHKANNGIRFAKW